MLTLDFTTEDHQLQVYLDLLTSITLFSSMPLLRV